jgi:hypothetical protein
MAAGLPLGSPEFGNGQMKKRNLRPKFKTEAEERKFWETHDSTNYIDWSKPERVIDR